MKLKFSKMHGIGNDFVVIDAINQQVVLTIDQIRLLADRRYGVGCDQLLLVEKSSNPAVDFKYRIFNADGGEVAQCGNGARCFARFVYDKGLTAKTTIAVETASGIIYPSMKSGGEVTVDMGLPQFTPSNIPFVTEKQSITYRLPIADRQDVEIGAVSMGNPHAVLLVDDINTAEVSTLGAMIERHSQFPVRVNVGFMEVVNPSQINLRVFERGAGETLACGTGACAAVVSGIQRGLLAREVKVKLPGGELVIEWSNDNASVWMTGPTTHVFDGEIAWATINSN
jgi:diaminopimelate epimerase